MSLIDRVQIRRIIETRMDDVTGVQWIRAGHEEDAADGDDGNAVLGTLLDLRLDTPVINPGDPMTGECAFTVQMTVDAGRSQESYYAVEAAVQQVTTLLYDRTLRDTDGAYHLTAFHISSDVSYGADDADGLIVGLVTARCHMMRISGTTYEDAQPA